MNKNPLSKISSNTERNTAHKPHSDISEGKAEVKGYSMYPEDLDVIDDLMKEFVGISKSLNRRRNIKSLVIRVALHYLDDSLRKNDRETKNKVKELIVDRF